MKRDDGEFTELASACGVRLLHTAYLLTGDWHLAEDLVQESFGKAYAAWGRLSKIDNPAAYLQTILVRTFYTHRRRRSSGELPHQDFPDVGTEDVDIALRVSLMDGLARLKPKERAVIVLRYWEDRSVEETAAILRLTPTAVRSQSLRALAKLRAILGPRYVDFAEIPSTATSVPKIISEGTTEYVI